MFMLSMRTIAADSKPIQYGNPHCSNEVSIRCTAHLSFTKFEPDHRPNAASSFE